MPVPKVPAAVKNYLASFGSVAVVLTARGSILAVANPTGYERAWWVRKQDAPRLVEESRERGNVEASARRLGIALTPHDVAAMKADRALARLDLILRSAQQNGDLKRFNSEYAARRQHAVGTGATYMGYSAAHAKLRKALMIAIGDGCQGREFSLAFARVFDPPSSTPS
jgi:hypothetical protein